ncbi:MAG: ATP-binding protein [bacterium]
MIVNFKRDVEVEKTTDVIDDVEMTFDKDAMAIQFQMFINNIYSNPIGSIVREITSNAVDSHIEAGIEEPVKIKISEENGDKFISFIDYGVGMSPERVKIYSSFLTSTKRTNNNEIGGWGVGGKSILAYKRYTGIASEYDNSYNIVTRFNGEEYGYYIYEGSDRPIITQLYKTQTNEGNGTEIKIPIKNEDIPQFISEIKRQLFYFDNVLYQGFEKYTNTDLNDYKIVEGENFIYRGDTYDSHIHVCLGKVAYPIDYSAVGLGRYDNNVPVAIKLPVGSIGVTVSREALDYSQETIKLIREKIEEVKNELGQLYLKSNSNIKSIKDYVQHNMNQDKVIVFDNDLTLEVTDIVQNMKVPAYENFKYKNYIKPNVRSNKLFNILTYTANIANKRKKHSANTIHNIFEDNVYFIDTPLTTPSDRKVNKYLKFKHNGTFRVVRKSSYEAVFTSFLFGEIFVTNDPDYEVNAHIFNEIQQEFFNECLKPELKDYEKVTYPEDFFKRHKIAQDKQLINVAIIRNGFLNRSKIKFETLRKFKGSVYYGTKEQQQGLYDGVVITKYLFPHVRQLNNVSYDGQILTFQSMTGKLSTNKSAIGFVMLSKANAKKVSKLPQFHNISEFKTKMLRRKSDNLKLIHQREILKQKMDELGHEFIRVIKQPEFNEINDNLYLKYQKLKEEISLVKVEIAKMNVHQSLAESRETSYLRNLLLTYIKENIESLSEKYTKLFDEIQPLIDYQNQITGYFDVMYLHDRNKHFWDIIKMINDKIIKENKS